jgi:3-methylfumaryl-CoA hydratase
MSTDYKEWIGKQEIAEDIASPAPLAGLAALLDHDTPPWIAGEVPPLGHWLYFLPRARQSEIGADGHPKRRGFLPPIELPRRMWAGSRITWHAPIKIGAKIANRSMIKMIERKAGASGEMVFLTVAQEISADGKLAVAEERDVVFRAASKVGETVRAGASERREPEYSRTLMPDETQLFRFSALTFNAHRIHYDRDYTTKVEGYPALVVQGPYTAMLLMDHYLRRHPQARVKSFAFRARAPHFEGRPLKLCATGGELWSEDGTGATGMTATISPAP